MTVLGQVAHGSVGRGRLAAARFADETVGLARLDLEGHPAQNRAWDATDFIGDMKIVEFECERSGRGLCGTQSSITSWRRSAIKLTAITRLAIANAGKTVTHQ